ncbi:MAG TPA: response regulator transcription factor [Actinomycetota bacterium]|jgi:DNA-binding NarL/FixJ family response regulator|nr:response regulator transcription factor [Actinomycetota bacterium]
MIVDDHALVRRGMAHVVRECFADADVVEAADAAEAMGVMERTPADIALVDVRLPVHDGLELLHDMKSRWREVPVIMLTTFDHAQYVRRALAEGAAGYLLKDATPEDLEQAIRVALSGGGNVLSPRVIQNLFEAMETGEGEEEAPHRRPAANLTQRETDILELLAEGKSNRDISRSLFLSEKTVKAHLAAIFRKLGVSNRTQAAMAAVSMGIGSAHFPVDRAEAVGSGAGDRS